MTTEDSGAPVYGPPKRNNFAEWQRHCLSERPWTATVKASKDRFQRALLGCYVAPAQSNVDGAVAAALTFREQRPPKLHVPCPHSREPCKPPPPAEPSPPLKHQSPCDHIASQQLYRPKVDTSHPPPDLLPQRRPYSACTHRAEKVGVPPYVAPHRHLTGIPVRAATDCVYQFIRSATKDGPRPPPLETTLLQRGSVCGPSDPCAHFEPLKDVAQRRCAVAGMAPSDKVPPPPVPTPPTAPACQPSVLKERPCGLTGVAGPYLGGPVFVGAEQPEFLTQPTLTAPCREKGQLGGAPVPPYVWPPPKPGTRIRLCTDCLPKRPCPGYPLPPTPERCAHFSPVCELGYFGQLVNDPCVYPCCVSEEQSEQLARQMRWKTMASSQMEEIQHPPRAKVPTPNTTYEELADAVKYRVRRYEPVTALWQQVPDVWDRAQTRQMMDMVVADSDYEHKVNHVLPTGHVMRNNKMVMKPCLQPSHLCRLSRDINVETPCKFGETTFTPDVYPAKMVCPACI